VENINHKGENMTNRIVSLIGITVLSAGLWACSETEEGSAEKQGKVIDQALEDAKASSEEKTEELEETIEQAEKDLQETADHAKELTGEQIRELGESMQETGQEMQK
jgi:uncharacterized protein HemX